MHLHLMSLDRGYVKCVEQGPHVSMKVCKGVGFDGEYNVGKMISKPWMNIHQRIPKRGTQRQEDHEHSI